MPRGFRFAATACGLKKTGALDLAILSSDVPASAAAVFTQNLVVAAPVLISKEHLRASKGHMRAVAYYLYDWRLKDGSKVAFECADVFNFDPDTGRIASVVLVYDTHLIRDAVENKYP